MDVTLVGGGRDVIAQVDCLSPFLAAATARAGGTPRIGFVWVDEGDGPGGADRWISLVGEVGPLSPVDLPVGLGDSFPAESLDGLDGLFVCGGLTPAYASALTTAAADVRRRVLVDGLPYAGWSAGAAVAATDAVVGGYLDGGAVVCPPDSAEDLDDVTVVPGLGLVDLLVDVHASAWGTLPRLAAALHRQADGAVGIGLDEDTAWHTTGAGDADVLGRNAVHVLTRAGDEIRWSIRRPPP